MEPNSIKTRLMFSSQPQKWLSRSRSLPKARRVPEKHRHDKNQKAYCRVSSRPLIEGVKATIITPSFELVVFARTRMEQDVIGDAASRRDLQYAGLRTARVVRQVTKCAPCRRVRRKDEAIRPAGNVNTVCRIG